MQRRWIDPSQVPLSTELLELVGNNRLLAQALQRRGLDEPARVRAFLDPEWYTPSPPEALPDLEHAAERLLAAIRGQETILVWGDFDVDGQTATTLLVSALRRLGGQVQYYIPVRERESHGVHLPSLEKCLAGAPRVLLTCDTGITAHAALAYARQRGLSVLVTDHHDLPPELPEAEAIVNPKRLPPGHPLGTLPGVGVAYKLAEALYERSGIASESAALLDLAALGIVADVATLSGDTRYLLQRGLAELRHTERLGLRILMEQAELNPAGLSEEHIGFVIGPRLNALGRLGDANPIVEFFTTQDRTRATLFALELEGLNARRQMLTDQILHAALAQIEKDPSLLDLQALVLAHPSWPGGVIGIVASRLVELYHKPVILLTTPPGEAARGSARSIEGVNISQAIASQANLLYGFGGHPMAAGLSLAMENIPAFRQGLSDEVGRQLAAAHIEPTLAIDAWLALAEINLELVKDIERLSPFGAGNPPLTLASRSLEVESVRQVGRGGEHRLVNVSDESGRSQQVIWWQSAGLETPQGRFDLAYSLHAHSFQGQQAVQVVWQEARPVPGQAIVIPQPQIILVDHRDQAFPLPILQQLVQADVQVWCEAGSPTGIPSRDRLGLETSPELAIWSLPPGRAELRLALQAAQPRKLYLFAHDPGMDDMEAFLKRLAGLVKYALKQHAGQVELEQLAAATAQRVFTAQAGCLWLMQRGLVQVSFEGNRACFQPGIPDAQVDTAATEGVLKSLLAESAAFRLYYRRAALESLL